MIKLLALLCLAVPTTALATVDSGSSNRQEIIVGGKYLTTVTCKGSATGRCYNVLFDGPSGGVIDAFFLHVGESKSFVDLPEDATVCLTDAHIDDPQTCQRKPVHTTPH